MQTLPLAGAKNRFAGRLRNFLITLFMLSALSGAFGQAEIIDDCIRYMGQPVGEGFSMVRRTLYKNDDGVNLYLEDGLVTMVVIGKAFSANYDASEYVRSYYNYFEERAWYFYSTEDDGTDIYSNGDVWAQIKMPERRGDGVVTSLIIITKEKFLFE